MPNIHNFEGNEDFRWCLVRYLHLADHHQIRTRTNDKLFEDELDFEDISIKMKEIQKTEKKGYIGISVFSYENKLKYPSYVSKNTFKNMLIYYY